MNEEEVRINLSNDINANTQEETREDNQEIQSEITTEETTEKTEEIIDVPNALYDIKEFNTLDTTQGTLKFNEEMYIQIRTTNIYLNLILLAITTCFLYYVISKALKKLFYINI